MAVDFSTQSDIRRSIKRIKQLISSNIFAPTNAQNILVESAFIELCILLNDLLAKTAKYSNRVVFTDDVTIIPKQVEDVTDLVSKVRNAVCHISSPLHLVVAPNMLGASFNILYGKVSGAVKINYPAAS